MSVEARKLSVRFNPDPHSYAAASAVVFGDAMALLVAEHYRKHAHPMGAVAGPRVTIEDEPDRPQSSDVVHRWEYAVIASTGERGWVQRK